MSQIEEQAQYQKAPSLGWSTKTAWAWISQNRAELWARTRYPFILLAVMGWIGNLLAPQPGIEEVSGFDTFVAFALAAASIVATAMLAVATHRLVLLGADGSQQSAPLVLGKREVRFVLYEIALYLCALVPVAVVGLLVGLVALAASPGALSLLMLAGVPLAMMVVMRLSFVLPAVALDKETSLAVAWAQSRGWFLSYSIAILSAMLLLFLPIALIFFIAISFFAESAGLLFVLDMLFSVVACVGVWVMATVLSVSYGHAVSHSNSEELRELANPSDRLE